MATKDQVLKLLEKGLNPQQIAKKLGCKDGYVRATKARAFGNGREVQRRYDEAHKAERRAWMRDYKRERRATDPEYREYEREHSRKRYQNDPSTASASASVLSGITTPAKPSNPNPQTKRPGSPRANRDPGQTLILGGT